MACRFASIFFNTRFFNFWNHNCFNKYCYRCFNKFGDKSNYFKFIPLLFILLFLFGGGFIPPLIGMISSTYYVIKRKSNMNNNQPSFLRKLIAKLWIYLISFLILWFPSSWIIGWIFPAFRLQISSATFIMFDIILPILILLAANIKFGIVDGYKHERLEPSV